jgi:hypothetical protein
MLDKMKKSFSEDMNRAPKRSFIVQSLFFGTLITGLGLGYDMLVPNEDYWFARMGAMMCMFAILAEFRLQQLDRILLQEDWNDRITNKKALDEPMFISDDFFNGMKMISHAMVVLGTIIWAFGDKFVDFLK